MLGQWVSFAVVLLIASIGFSFIVAKHIKVAPRHPYGWRRLSDSEITDDLLMLSERYLSRGDPAGTTYIATPPAGGYFLAIVQQHHTGSRVRGISLFARPWRDVQ